MSFIQYLGFDDHYFRLIGTFLDPNYTGALLSSLSVLLLAQGRIFPSLLLLVPLGLTFSRASYLSLVVPLALLALLKRKYIYVLLPLLLVLAVIIAPKPFGEGVNLLRTFSIFSRLGSWQEGMSLFVQRPLLGFGYNTLTTDTGRIGIDNSFIYLLATTGILGLASFLYFLYLSFIRISLPLRLSLVSLLIHALFNNTLFFPWITVFLIVLILKD
jgi:O-antigen ligase